MENINKQEEKPKSIFYNNKEYLITHPNIRLDCISNEYFHDIDATYISSSIKISDSKLVDYSHNTLCIRYQNIEKYLQEGQLIKLEFGKDGNYLLLKSDIVPYLISGGIKFLEKENIYVDSVAFKHIYANNKYRPFNNIIKKNKYLDNDLLDEESKKELLKRDLDFGVRTLTNKIFEGLNYTFGVEFETMSGRVNEKEAEDLNLLCEFDGSLREFPDQKKEDVLGSEYVTGVLIGDSGMYQIQKITNILSKKCTIGPKAGLHVHIGSIKFTKENIVYLYMLGLILENEIFDMLPKSRKLNSYCKPLKKLKFDKLFNKSISPLDYKILISSFYNDIFKYVSFGSLPSKKSNKSTNHPLGSKCGYNKETQRYCWLNFVTAMFNTKNNPNAMTLEFRNHSSTLSYVKIKNWIKICVAFVNFAENHKSSIKQGYWINKQGEKNDICLNTIINAAYPKTGKLIIDYIDKRKSKFFFDSNVTENEEYFEKNENIILNLKESVCA